MIAWERVQELKEEIGAEDFSEVVEIFLEELDEAVGRLLAADDPGRVAADLHFLKSATLNLGFRGLSDFCAAAEARDPPAFDPAQLKTLNAASRTAFLDGLDRAGATAGTAL